MEQSSPTSPHFFEDASQTSVVSQAAQAAETLEQLQTDAQVELLNVIDDLRMAGLNKHGISLPQLVVCGQQSSGKSSLLESLTDLRFPTDTKVCTLFPTEVIMRDAADVEISCTIIPMASRSEIEQRKLKNFKRSFSSREDFDLISVVEDAKREMALRKTEKTEDVLRIKYCGPKLPSLTIVDIPGIISSGGDGADVIQRLVKTYMEVSRSIILAVVPANNHTDNQGVIELYAKADPEGARTLGIITKTDRADAGEQQEVMKLIRNEIHPLKYGWHAVKNRDPEMRDSSSEEREESERLLFGSGRWASLPRDKVGIPMLRKKLCRVLLEHITQELPPLVNAVQVETTRTVEKLRSMGDARDTSKQQCRYLIAQAERFQTLTQDALRSSYENKFFRSESQEDLTRLRTRVQNLNIGFAHITYERGHMWHIDESAQPQTQNLDSIPQHPVPGREGFRHEPCIISRQQMLEMIGQCTRRNLPRGLLETINPSVIGEMFRKQSQAWGKIASDHIQTVFNAVREYIVAALNFTMDSRTSSMLMHKHIDPQLKLRKADMEAKVEELLVPFTEAEPTTYDPTFQQELAYLRSTRYNIDPDTLTADSALTIFEKLRRSSMYSSTDAKQELLSVGDLTNADILDYVSIYYKRAVTVFISNITSLAVENCLLKNLHAIFCPSLVVEMSDETLYSIAAESEDLRSQRDAVRERLRVLKDSKEILDGHIAGQLIPYEIQTTKHIDESCHDYAATRQACSALGTQKESGQLSGYEKVFVVTPPDSATATPLRSRSRHDSATASPTPRKIGRRGSPLPRRFPLGPPAPAIENGSDTDS